MAFMAALPLGGLNPNDFTHLGSMLLGEVQSSSEESSPNTSNSSSEANGDNNLAVFGSISDEGALSSAQSSFSVESEYPSRERRKKKESLQPRIMYQGRDVLNLGANIRDPVWITRDSWIGDFESTTSSRSIIQRMQKQMLGEEDTTKSCSHCKFRQLHPYLY